MTGSGGVPGGVPDGGPDELARAEHLLELGRHDEARTAARVLLAHAPDDPGALDLFVTACLPLGDKAALPAAQALVRICPDESRPLTLAAQAAAAQGDQVLARQYADAAIVLAPDDVDVHQVRGYIDLIGMSTDDGLAAARRAVALEPDEAETHRVLGALLLKRAKLDDAEASLRTALAIEPGHAGALDDLARLALERMTPIEAASRFADILARDPGDDHVAHNALAALGRPVGSMHTIALVPALWFLLDAGSTSDTVAAYVGIVAAMVTAATLARSMVRRMPASGGRLFGLALRRDRLLLLLGLVLIAAYVALYAVPVAPDLVLDGIRSTYLWLVLGAGTTLRVLRLLLGRSRVRPML